MNLHTSHPRRRLSLFGLACGAVAAVLAAAPAFAQAPGAGKPIRLVVAYATGGSIDLAARRISDDLATELGQPVIVENRGGANGVNATEYVARAAPDGLTLLFTTLPAHAGNRAAYKKLPYDTIADFTPVTVLSIVPLVLVAHPSLPANNMAELVKLARERPGKINYASFGVGGTSHLAGVQMNRVSKTEMGHIPYKGGAPAIADVVGGHVHLYFSSVGLAQPFIKEGKLKAIAVSSLTRLSSMPNVPMVAETPGFENFEAVVAPIILAPAKTPPDVVSRIQAAALKVTQTPKYRAKLEAAGEGEPRATSPEQSMAMLKKEVAHLADLFKAAGVQPE